MTLRNNASAISGTFDAVAPGGAVAGAVIDMGNLSPRIKHLSAKLTILAETNTITLTAKWQVSSDKVSWFDVANGTQNAAGVALGTGTAGAESAVSKVIAAPDAAYSWPWARVAVAVGGTTGTTADTYAISYSYRQLTGADRP